jgi:hypothetical protein
MFKIIAILLVMMPALARAQDAPCASPLAAPDPFVAGIVDQSVDSALAQVGAGNLPDRIAVLSGRAQTQVRSLSDGLQLSPAEIGGYYVAAVCRRLLAQGQSGDRLKASVAPLALALNAPLPGLPGGSAAPAPLDSPPFSLAETQQPGPSSRAGTSARDMLPGNRGIAFEPPLALPAPPPPVSPLASATEAAGAWGARQDGAPPSDARSAVQPRDMEDVAKPAEPAPRNPASPGIVARQKPVTVGDAASNKTTISIDLGGVPDHEGAGAKSETGLRTMAAAGDECAAAGVIGHCTDYAAVIKNLRQKPIEYNHPRTMHLGRKTQISLVLRSDWKGDAAPEGTSDEMKGLPGAVEKGSSKVTQIMSAKLAGAAFDVDPNGAQERLITTGAPTVWTWFVTPAQTGTAQRLKLELFAHIQAGGETKPPVLIKTLDAAIDVDVTAWDWLIIQARAIEPVYGIMATAAGLAMALSGFLYRRIVVRRNRQTVVSKRRYLGSYTEDGA